MSDSVQTAKSCVLSCVGAFGNAFAQAVTKDRKPCSQKPYVLIWDGRCGLVFSLRWGEQRAGFAEV
ncbi:MAG: hypothetical protein LDL37_07945 [Asticcacaulis sp.]|uniref:hypothetical protein n=1 Tax=Asticcacaulis sp. TaxID=1872648 RepID=UPI0025BBCF96|nr:hypothetical protein [Asticcacaulis sp.]MCA1935367.1 hypothetical protein [Asticcacaulis sp.]